MMLVGTFSQSELDLHFCCVQDEVVEARLKAHENPELLRNYAKSRV